MNHKYCFLLWLKHGKRDLYIDVDEAKHWMVFVAVVVVVVVVVVVPVTSLKR